LAIFNKHREAGTEDETGLAKRRLQPGEGDAPYDLTDEEVVLKRITWNEGEGELPALIIDEKRVSRLRDDTKIKPMPPAAR